ncbi:hypothetical protein ACU045_06225 [Microbacterium sp. MAHUQ-60]|uniref:hypothetical protein n=1 Tax=unclassified Microbacterium TaxID=2609290 RepID=UPI003610BBCA
MAKGAPEIDGRAGPRTASVLVAVAALGLAAGFMESACGPHLALLIGALVLGLGWAQHPFALLNPACAAHITGADAESSSANNVRCAGMAREPRRAARALDAPSSTRSVIPPPNGRSRQPRG